MPIEQAEKQEVEYQRPVSQYATRRQFRWVMILLILNLAITLQTAYWPGLAANLRDQWTQYRERRKLLALQQQALDFVEPSTKVVWDEDPQTAAKLLESGGYGGIRVEGLESHPALANWPMGAHAIVPDPADQYYRATIGGRYRHPFPNRGGERSIERGEAAMVLMHGFKTPAGEERLVYVYVRGKLNLSWTQLPGRDGAFQFQPRPPNLEKPFSSTIARELELVAFPCSLNREDGRMDLIAGDGTSLLIHPPREFEQNWSWIPATEDQPEQIRLEGGPQFRFYAGQPDPGDPSHFTIVYEVNGKRGTIDGRLKTNGKVELKPDKGKVTANRWYLP